jgi:diguanylate cyclase (GGDEF)-like protein
VSRFPHALLVGAAVAVMAACVWLLGHAQRDAAARSFEQTEQAQAMLAAMLDQETGLRGFLLNRRTEFIAPFSRGGRHFARALAAARRAGGPDREVDALLDRSEELAGRWRESAEAALRRPGHVPLSDAVRRKAVMDAFRSVNASLRRALDERRSRELSRASSLSAGLIVLLSAVFGGLGWLLVGRPVAAQRRREARRAVSRDRQTAFANALQMADSEEEAHTLVKRHLERSVDRSGVTVLYRDASGARLEATTEVDERTPLAVALKHAEPRSCLAVRLGAPHEQGGPAVALMRCELCGKTGRERSTCAPLLVSGEVIGAVQVAHDNGLAAEEREHVTDTVTQAAPVIANLRNLAVAELRAATDPLTGLANRRSLNDTIKRMLAQAARSEGSLSCIALDLDHFKRINDRHGHDRGDDVLAAAATALTSTLRVSDFVARSGGEEFVVLLPDTGLDGALVVAENLRSALQAMAVPGVDAPVTGSFGVAVHPEDAPTAEDLLRRADRALYLAKRNGRNRVEAAAAADDGSPLA